MTIDTQEKPKPNVDSRLFKFTVANPAPPIERLDLAYADVELSTELETADFDVRTVAIVAGIIVFKLSMLGLLLVSI